MKVFITGGTGLIGAAVVAELVAHDHEVTALARSDRSAATLRELGATPVMGELADLDVIRASADAADGAVQLAFDHAAAGAEGFERSMRDEGAAVAAIGEVLVGTDKPYAVVSGTPWIAGRASTEDDPTPTEGVVAPRGHAVDAVLALAEQGVRSAAVRIPRTCHRDGHGGFAGLLTAVARESGVAGYPGDGAQRWPAVHALDAASLFRLVLEGAPAGSVWHAVGEEAVSVRATVDVIGRRLGLPVEAVPEETFGPMGAIFAMDQPSTSTLTRERLGWEPTHAGLLEDLELLEP